MHPAKPPKIAAVEVVATQPTEADSASIAHLSEQAGKALPKVAYVVKVRLQSIPPATSHGWALYVGSFRVPKYWEFKHGIYFKVFDPQFFVEHKGQPLRFSSNGSEFIETGKKLPATSAAAPKVRGKASSLPLLEEALE